MNPKNNTKIIIGLVILGVIACCLCTASAIGIWYFASEKDKQINDVSPSLTPVPTTEPNISPTRETRPTPTFIPRSDETQLKFNNFDLYISYNGPKSGLAYEILNTESVEDDSITNLKTFDNLFDEYFYTNPVIFASQLDSYIVLGPSSMYTFSIVSQNELQKISENKTSTYKSEYLDCDGTLAVTNSYGMDFIQITCTTSSSFEGDVTKMKRNMYAYDLENGYFFLEARPVDSAGDYTDPIILQDIRSIRVH